MGICSVTQGAQTLLCDNLEGWGEVGERFKREGTYVYLWLIHADVWQKPTQCVKQLSFNKKKKKKKPECLGQRGGGCGGESFL